MGFFSRFRKKKADTQFMLVGSFEFEEDIYDVVVFKEQEFNVPHIHIAPRSDRTREFMVKLLSAEYYDHGRETYEHMSYDLANMLAMWLGGVNGQINGSNWDRCIFDWVALNQMSDENMKKVENGSPNYIKGIEAPLTVN